MLHTLLTIVAFLIIFSLLIFVHELGHFAMAKRHGIKVEEFGFGLPPRIWGKKKGETIYSLNWIPFGGFVRLYGEDPRDKKAMKSTRSFMRKSLWQRTQVICAGVVMNLLLAWVLLTTGFMVGMQPIVIEGDGLDEIRNGHIQLAYEEGEPDNTFELPQVEIWQSIPEMKAAEERDLFKDGDVVVAVNGMRVFWSEEFEAAMKQAYLEGQTVVFTLLREEALIEVPWSFSTRPQTIVAQVLPDSPAEEAGLLPGDVVMSVNKASVTVPQDALQALGDSKAVDYEILRGDVAYLFTMEKNKDGRVGVLLTLITHPEALPFSYFDSFAVVSVTSVEPVRYAWYKAPIQALREIKTVGQITVVMVAGVFKDIFTTGTVPEGVAGPVGIAQMTGQFLNEGLVALMRFTALLSLSLAVINIFPFPALDGGRFLFILIEAVRGKPVDPTLEGTLHMIGFFLLITVIFLVTFQDIARMVG